MLSDEERIPTYIVKGAGDLIHIVKLLYKFNVGTKVIILAAAVVIEATRWSEKREGGITRKELMDFQKLAEKEAKHRFDSMDKNDVTGFISSILNPRM